VQQPGVKPKVFSMILLREPFERLVSFAVYMGVTQVQ
jgi:hypothetical protein